MANQDFVTTGGIQAQSATLVNSLTLGNDASYNTSRTVYADSIVVICPIDGVSWVSEDNGLTFIQHQLPDDNYSNIINDGTKFYAMGDQGTFSYSYNGLTWTKKENDYSGDPLVGLAKSGSKFVAVANNGDFLSSLNGTTWNQDTLELSGSNNVFIAGGGNQFVVIESNNDTVNYSSNGSVWDFTTLPISSNWMQLSYGNGYFLLVDDATNILSSTDGISWDINSLADSAGLDDTSTDVQYLNGNYIVVSPAEITYSTDLANWTLQSGLFDGTNKKYITFVNNQYFVAEEVTGVGYTSTDLITWNAGSIFDPQEVDNSSIAALSGFHSATATVSSVAPSAFASLGNLRGDIQGQIDTKAPTASPTFTGTVVLPSTITIGSTTGTELGYVHGVTSSIQTQLNAKIGTTVNGVTITETELSYLSGVTSNIQDQINAAGTGGGGGGTTGDAILDPMFLLGGV